MVLRFFMLAGVFLCISCTDFERNNPNDPGSDNYRGYQVVNPPLSSSGRSSSSVAVSSSSSKLSSSSSAPSSSSVAKSSSSLAISSSSSKPSSSSSTPPSSSSLAQSSSSALVSSSSSSSVAKSSSSVAVSSSSSKPNSSSSVVTTLTCTGLSQTGVAGIAITQPTVKCGTTNVSSPTFTGAPTWDNPTANTYTVSANATGTCTKSASCGTIKINPKLSCGDPSPTTVIAGSAVTPPTVTCGTTTVATASVSWNGAPTYWSSPQAGTYNNIKATATSGDCSGQTATCGTLTVNNKLTCNSVTQTITTGQTPTKSTVTCGTTEVTSSITWSPTSINNAINTAQTISNVTATASCGGSNQTANCAGTITVIAYSLACANLPIIGTAGTAITQPTVTCNSSNGTSTSVTSGLTWTGAPTYANPVAGTYSSISVSTNSGNCSGKSTTCSGTLTIQPKPNVVYGTPVTYEGETYKTVVIGTQTWFQRNLNYAVAGSKCGGDDGLLKDENTSYCDTYGRLYYWTTAMVLNCGQVSCASQISAKHRGICPFGWHIPSDAEWTTLTDFVGGASIAGITLKATSGWDDYEGKSGNGYDTYGFSALQGGGGYGTGIFFLNDANWWSASEASDRYAHTRHMYGSEGVGRSNQLKQSYLFAVRCLKD